MLTSPECCCYWPHWVCSILLHTVCAARRRLHLAWTHARPGGSRPNWCSRLCPSPSVETLRSLRRWVHPGTTRPSSSSGWPSCSWLANPACAATPLAPSYLVSRFNSTLYRPIWPACFSPTGVPDTPSHSSGRASYSRWFSQWNPGCWAPWHPPWTDCLCTIIQEFWRSGRCVSAKSLCLHPSTQTCGSPSAKTGCLHSKCHFLCDMSNSELLGACSGAAPPAPTNRFHLGWSSLFLLFLQISHFCHFLRPECWRGWCLCESTF